MYIKILLKLLESTLLMLLFVSKKKKVDTHLQIKLKINFIKKCTIRLIEKVLLSIPLFKVRIIIHISNTKLPSLTNLKHNFGQEIMWLEC